MNPISLLPLYLKWKWGLFQDRDANSHKAGWPRREGEVDLSTGGGELGQLGETHEGNQVKEVVEEEEEDGGKDN